MRARAALAVLAACALPAEAREPLPSVVERPIAAGAGGKTVVVLDHDVYQWARPDLGDLRVLDGPGRAVPYLLDSPQEPPQPPPRQPRVLNRTFVRGQSSSVVLDFGAPMLKTELALSLSGDNFRRRVSVEGRNRHDQGWETVTDGAYVFAVPPPAAARYETVVLPENNFQLLKVTVHNGPDDDEPVEIRSAQAWPRERRRPREEVVRLGARPFEDEKAHETVLVADLGARHQPFRGLLLDVADAQFFRGVVVEARIEPPAAPAEPPAWRLLDQGTLYRYPQGDERHEKVRLDVTGRERMLRVRIRNRDDRPLQVRGLSVAQPVERLVFQSEPGASYRLRYGDPTLAAPVYDVARTVGDPAIWIAQAVPAALGQPVRVARSGPPVPWTERHPALLWAGLGTLVVVLGTVTWRALRAAE